MGVSTDSGYHSTLAALRKNLGSVIQGKPESVDVLLTAFLAGGSVLVEDVPGVGKTTLAKALAKSVDLTFRRIQFTPDLLPGDILGSSIYSPVNGTFTFRQGPIFCNILLADEINRASPRTQSALLEAMSETQATIEGTTHVLPGPFLVIATQNPVEFHGTYPLPEAQLDRFIALLSLGYPAPDVEADILFAQAESHPLEHLKSVTSGEEVIAMQQAVRRVRVDASLAHYIVAIVNRTRSDARFKLGVSPRGSLMLYRAAQAAAFLDGRDYTLPDDVQRLAPHVLAHRVMLTSKAKYGGIEKRAVIEELLREVNVPA
ncbi:MAG: MoxR family ATPase [Candidatus Hydrogenedentes bacterium]|nr:MoxR family ATPase [Candidatus Hydrogenedentota bacterium]